MGVQVSTYIIHCCLGGTLKWDLDREIGWGKLDVKKLAKQDDKVAEGIV